MRRVLRAESRFHTSRDGIETLHSFSYGDHYDPSRVGFGPLRAVNEERLPPGAGYPLHRHAEADIVTWVIDGALDHRDTAGGGGVIAPGRLQWLRAGSGVEHTEQNASDTESLAFLQMMVAADHDSTPSYGLTDDPVLVLGRNALLVVVGHQALPGAERVLAHVVRGTARAEGYILRPGDELWTDEPMPRLACGGDSLTLVWLLGADVRVLHGSRSRTLGDCLAELGGALGGREFADLDEVAACLDLAAAALDHEVTVLTLEPEQVLRDESRQLQRKLDDIASLAAAHSNGLLRFVSYAPSPSAAIRASWR